jgi:hypothetical protein
MKIEKQKDGGQLVPAQPSTPVQKVEVHTGICAGMNGTNHIDLRIGREVDEEAEPGQARAEDP